jgi:hypothetical protein
MDVRQGPDNFDQYGAPPAPIGGMGVAIIFCPIRPTGPANTLSKSSRDYSRFYSFINLRMNV